MLRMNRKAFAAVLAAALLAALGVGFAVRADKAGTKELGGPERYLTLLSTDKPIYREGESVYARGILLHAFTRKPAPQEAGQAMIEVKGPKGEIVARSWAGLKDSLFGFKWDIPAGSAGGQYTLRLTHPHSGHAPAERNFEIRAYRAPRLKSQIVFLREGYGPGDEVSATLEVKRAEGGVPEGAQATVTARVDGAEVFRGQAKVDAQGRCTGVFKLPEAIARGEGTLAFAIQDGGVVETAAKTIPILLQTLDLQLYPEGGELVGGVENRVYLQARRLDGKPADLEGYVQVDLSKLPQSWNGPVPGPVAEFSTAHEGRGRFAFKPEAGGTYLLHITKPAGIARTFALGEVKAAGVAFQALEDRTAAGGPVRLRLASPADAELKVTLAQREIEAAAATVNVQAGKAVELQLDPKAADGVLTATVWDKAGKPLAERLVYREPAHKLKVSIVPDRKSYVPGGAVKLTVRTTDQQDRPVGAVVGLTVTDDSVLEMIETREQAPRLPEMALLENEVGELADAHVYLDPENPKAPQALDLLLGTQGWRRFALMRMNEFLAAHGDAGRRALALRLVARHEQNSALQEGKDGGVWMLGAPMPAGAAPEEGRRADAAPARAMEDKAPPPAPAEPQPPAVVAAEQKQRREVEQPDSPERQAMRDALEKADAKAAENRLMAKEEVAEREKDRSFVMVREFAHAARPNRQPNARSDFAETLYWHAGIATDAKTGEATVAFALSDAVTAFRVLADAFGADGALGAGRGGVESVEPFYLEPKLPLEVTAGDAIELPVAFVNGIDSALGGVAVEARGAGELKLDPLAPFDLGALERARRILKIKVGAFNGAADFELFARAGAYSDKVTRKLNVVPQGFPYEKPFGGLLDAAHPAQHKVVIPANAIPRSIQTKVAVFPTPLANLTQALERLIQEPSGCFEQTSSTSYPLTMAQQYFMSHTGVDPALVERSRKILDAGYKRLAGFETPKHGYEWFGEAPGHEALTAYGLLHFSDMAQVREVDGGMLARTRQWLMAQRDGKGSFKRERRALHTWIEDADCSNAYIVWALLESGEPVENLKTELDALKAAAKASKNSYVLALAANALYLGGAKAEAVELMRRLQASQAADGQVKGFVKGSSSSIVGSSGETLDIETTALAVVAWLREAEFAGAVEASMKYVAESCKSGRYGSTQSTILALRAIVAYDKSRARPKAPGRVRVFVDGQGVGDWANFDTATQDAIALPDLSELLTPGEHAIEVKMEDGAQMPYSVSVKYHDLKPDSAADCKVKLETKLAGEKLEEGAVTEVQVAVRNTAKEAVPNPVAIVGLPGGLEPRHDQLKELVKKGTIDAYEVRGREVVFYWRGLKAETTVELPLSCVAAVPGTYAGPASRAYLYYADDKKDWNEGLKVTIAAK